VRKVRSGTRKGLWGSIVTFIIYNTGIPKFVRRSTAVLIFKDVSYVGSLINIFKRGTVQWSNPGDGEIFRTRQDPAWGPLRLYNGFRVIPSVIVSEAWR
jgi:hypothetical protein